MDGPEASGRNPVVALRDIAFALEAAAAPTFRSRAFERAASTIESMPPADVLELALAGQLQTIAGIGETMERTILEALAGRPPEYLERLRKEADDKMPDAARAMLAALKGDCHVHSDWSDGHAPIEAMARAAMALGREYMVLTDHSPRLTIARGLSVERLEQQLEVVEALRPRLAPFRLLTGIECDILEDGGLDQEERLLSKLDVVVGSVHSKLRQDSQGMTRRMLLALQNPHLDILGHCTGRLVVGRGRPESTFDHRAVFEMALKHDKAIEINSRPERVDPPDNLLSMALDMGCRFAIDTDSHAPGQLTWLRLGSIRAAEHGLPHGRVVNTMDADGLLAWTASHEPTAPRTKTKAGRRD